MDLSLSIFQEQCHVVNDLLMSKNLFLKVYKLRKTFSYLIKKVPQGKNTVQRDLSACVEEHFNGFKLVRKISENERRWLFKPVDNVYRHLSKINQIRNCYFSKL